jgi:ABC-type oligopeptide transport system substrate-binding subunit
LSRKLWLSTVTVAIALLAVFAGSAAAKTGKAGAVGGTLNVDISTDVDYTDPALDYLSTGWEIEYATCLKLMNYPDANGAKGSQLVPEAASGFPKVSNSGKTLIRRCSRLLFRSSATWPAPISPRSRVSRSRDRT